MEKESCRKAIRARTVDKYIFKWAGEFFFYHKKLGLGRAKTFDAPKIIMPRTVIELEAAYDEDGHTLIDRLYYLRTKNEEFSDKYILGLLNSKLINFFYRIVFGATHLQGGYLDLKGIDLEKIPFALIHQKEQQQIIKLVDKMLSLNKQLNSFGGKKTSETAKLEEEIKTIDKEIDQLVYELYGITKEEQKIIEESLK